MVAVGKTFNVFSYDAVLAKHLPDAELMRSSIFHGRGSYLIDTRKSSCMPIVLTKKKYYCILLLW